MSRLEETINERGETESQLQENDNLLKSVLLNGMDKELAEDILTIHKYCEEVDMFAMLTKALEEYVRLFRDINHGNRVNLRRCQVRAEDYRGGFMNPNNALPMTMDDNQMLDAFLIQQNTGYSIVYIPYIEKKKDRFWYASNDKLHNIQPL